jgi:hypothetical protein
VPAISSCGDGTKFDWNLSRGALLVDAGLWELMSEADANNTERVILVSAGFWFRSELANRFLHREPVVGGDTREETAAKENGGGLVRSWWRENPGKVLRKVG